MQAKVTWDKDLMFTGVADSGYAVRMDSKSGPETGVGPIELVAISLAGCTAMDVISILTKKQQQVRSFHVQVHARRATDYPKVITSAELEYVISGHEVDVAAVVRAIDLSVKHYCPVHAMLAKAFPISLRYSVLESDGMGAETVVKRGEYRPLPGSQEG
jgi:putative redox protein